ncbi:DinB family protein [Paenibacillus farraposensis]|uniref:DinB family protein n=1 Tax=Paenibacillus farraposensis TaxID=2807095 RepID=A0ABW4DH18_9BACL|nr:DinB family protein [Paenibacillus farraposensis]MCC3379570.1 DinB family protein [Paenibacillus farraposensis]
MNTTETLQRFEETVQHYLLELDSFSLEQLQYVPQEGEWSLGQMYLHLVDSALHMHLKNMELCLKPDGEMGLKTETGTAIFNLGGFPPMRIQVPPSPQYTPPQPTSKEDIVERLHTVIHRMREIEPVLRESSGGYTISHPRFGALNAREWFLLIEMHYRHHLLQKERLKRAIAG